MAIKNENYEVIFERESKDLASTAYLLKHRRSGARVLLISNDDDNKVFYIGFRTPPKDSTGVAHIMEHSTLCGSEKYPLKDPFVELVKGSLNTFLNAMTYPDKTVYPVASRNNKDFDNLMSVYMDAVFHPNIYKHPEIMRQEGWNYKIESPEDPIEYNGVVYNEMKGAFSSPDGVLDREIMNSLFPDTTYGVESGGDPDFIPDLTYEAFIDFHKKYYHPSNSYIYLYGDMDIEERLEWMDKEYLGGYSYEKIDSEIGIQKAFDEVRRVERPYPITDDEEEADNTYLSYNIVCGDSFDVKKICAMQMIMYALIDTQGAPIRQRLLDEGIGKDCNSFLDDGCLQTYMSISSKNANAEQEERFVEIIKEEFEKAAREGLNRKELIASLNSQKFKFKEADFGGYPKGLIYGLACFNSWLYCDEKPLLHLELSEIFDELEAALETSYYEDLIRDNLLENTHASVVVLKPQKGMAAEKEAKIAEKLAAYKASLSEEEINRLVAETKALAEYQEAEETKEALETIPLLAREDIKREPLGFSNKIITDTPIPCIQHDYVTNGIAYISIVFDANKIRKELFPYLGLLKTVVSFVDTENYTYSELNSEIDTYVGGFNMDAGVYGKFNDSKKMSALADITIKVLYENIGKAFDLIEESLFRGIYTDEKRLYELIAELKSKLQGSLLSSGHVAASLRANSYFSELSALKEQIGGIEFYKFIENIEKNFESEKGKLIASIEEVIKTIISDDMPVISITSDDEGMNILRERLPEFAEKLRVYSEANREFNGGICETPLKDRLYDFSGNGFELEQKNEAFKTSASVNYLARSGEYIEDAAQYRGSVPVFLSIMRYEYLWFNVRVQGGAYGCMANGTRSGSLRFVSYRDPNISRTNEIYVNAADFAENFDCDDREMTKYVIGTMSGVDAPLTPSGKGSRDMTAYICDYDLEAVKKTREELIDCTQEDIRALAPMVKKAMDAGNVCCIGSESKIEEDKALFKIVRNLFE